MKQMSVGVVLVTYNRLEKLKKAIACYEAQGLLPRYIVIVDNCSTDGTAAFLREWLEDEAVVDQDQADENDCHAANKEKPEGKRITSDKTKADIESLYKVQSNEQAPIKKILITISENRGGSGGFYAGLKYAIDRKDAAWIWVADDDAFPKQDAFAKANAFMHEHTDMMRSCAAICGMCINDDGSPAALHQAKIRQVLFCKQELPVSSKAYEQEYFSIDMYTFAGTFLRREAIIKAGLPIEDFFIYQDDYEHACRMRKQGRIYCVPEIVIHHNDNFMALNAVSWRDYYATRNAVIMYKWHFDKRSLWMRIARRLAMSVVSRNVTKIRVTIEAVRDGLAEKRGLHEIYRPGWEDAMTDKQPFLTVGIASYNYGRYLYENFNHIKNQGFKDIEVLYCDDGSSDNSTEVINQIKTENPDICVRLIKGEHKGLIANKNRILKYATGKYLMICDADDRMADGCLDRVCRKAKTTDADCVIGGFAELDEAGKTLSAHVPGKKNSKWMYSWHHGQIYKMSIIRKNNIRFLKHPDDALYFFQVHHSCRDVVFIPEVVYYWIRHPKSAGTKAGGWRPEKIWRNTVDGLIQLQKGLLTQQDRRDLMYYAYKWYYIGLTDLRMYGIKKQRNAAKQMKIQMQRLDPEYRKISHVYRAMCTPERSPSKIMVFGCYFTERMGLTGFISLVRAVVEKKDGNIR